MLVSNRRKLNRMSYDSSISMTYIPFNPTRIDKPDVGHWAERQLNNSDISILNGLSISIHLNNPEMYINAICNIITVIMHCRSYVKNNRITLHIFHLHILWLLHIVTYYMAQGPYYTIWYQSVHCTSDSLWLITYES